MATITDPASGPGKTGQILAWHDAAARAGAVALATVSSAPADTGPTEPVHIVGWWQSLFDRVLRIKAPRALCGELLIADPDRPGPSPDGPLCPVCVERGGSPGPWVGPHSVVANPFTTDRPAGST